MISQKRLFGLALAVLMAALWMPLDVLRAQEGDDVARLMQSMTAEAKIGQLFMVTFPGFEVADDSMIARLIREYHVGGVMLTPENGNIVNYGDTPRQVAALVGRLQEVAWEATLPEDGTPGGEAETPFVPLFVAVSHEGNGSPFTAIVNGMTPLPSQMTLGATWNPAYAEAAGEIAGRELRAVGVNMLFGPLLDVVETPRAGSGDLGVRSFGGDPFWVGQMGRAYIRGVHQGSQGAVAVIAKRFPGLGAADRSLEEEVSTVQCTLERLRQVDLAPFAAATQAEDPLARPDGLMVSHIRFQGLEGGRFVKTRPVSVDSQVLQRLMSLSEFSAWRQEGGVTVSDELGVRALRRFYDPTEGSFNSRRIAQEAFLAGNDVLLLSKFALDGSWEEQAANIESTIAFFRDRYESDPSFRVQVDAAVARILRLKLALYGGSFALDNVRPDIEQAGEVGEGGQELLAAIARDAVTLLSPPAPDLVPSPPVPQDRIVIFTDSRQELTCAVCDAEPAIDPLIIQQAILRLYGPQATGQVMPGHVSSFTFGQLEDYLASSVFPTPVSEEGESASPVPLHPIESALQNADWVLFAMLDPEGDPPQSRVVRRFLAEKAGALRQPYVIVLAYDAPYYLDVTEVSKLSAYYAVYSHTSASIEASVRALFGELVPAGNSPVSVPGVNYDLRVQVLPDPAQAITLYIGGLVEEGRPTPTPSPLRVGDELRLHTGVILDHNGNPVPDGTPVQFFFAYPAEGYERYVVATTCGGVATTAITLDRTGQLDVSIQADPGARTLALRITIREGEPAIITPFISTPPPTGLSPTATPTAAVPPPQFVRTPRPTPAPVDEAPIPTPSDPGPVDLALALGGVLGMGGACYYVVRVNRGSVSRALSLALWSAGGGLMLYALYAFRLPGMSWLREQVGAWAAVWVVLAGGAVPLLIGWASRLWKRSEVKRGE